jgi:hypothetical protein
MGTATKVVRTKRDTAIYQLKIELQYLKPVVWRRVLVPASIRLPQLHAAILRSMGWEGGHMHEFVIGHTHYGQPDPDFPEDPPVQREERVTLEKALGGLAMIRYVYDFGDDWEHKIKVEKILPPDPTLHLPACLDGANACPPEDVGGPPGYLEFLEAIKNPRHEEHETMVKWIGRPFDPAAFSLDEVNARLAEFKL